jgi:hypothetical protein
VVRWNGLGEIETCSAQVTCYNGSLSTQARRGWRMAEN